MSPFTQLGLTGGSLDRNFSPILNYLDEFDRHFSHRHRFMNCFIPRFDLEEDASFYYLFGEVPGAKVEDINIEAHDDHTLVVSGTTFRPTPLAMEGMQSPGHEFVKVNEDVPAFKNGEYVENEGAFAGHAAERSPMQENEPSPLGLNQHPNPSLGHPTSYIGPTVVEPATYYRYPPPTTGVQDNGRQAENPNQHRVLLSERLIGEFNRTFSFPTPIAEDGTKATVENGVLYLVVPKREVKRKSGRKIPILGNWRPGPAETNKEVK